MKKVKVVKGCGKGAAEKKSAADWKADLALIAERIDDVVRESHLLQIAKSIC